MENIYLSSNYLRKKEQRLLNEKYPEEANQSPEQGDLSMDYQSAMKRNKQLKQVLIIR